MSRARTASATYFATASRRLTATATATGAATTPALRAAGLRVEVSEGAVLADTGLRLAT